MAKCLAGNADERYDPVVYIIAQPSYLLGVVQSGRVLRSDRRSLGSNPSTQTDSWQIPLYGASELYASLGKAMERDEYV